MPGLVEVFETLPEIDSTNEYLKQFVGQKTTRAVLAAKQTAGRGRYGRRWDSPPGKGLYVSYLVFPGWEQKRAPLLTAMASLAVLRSLRRLKGPQKHLHLKSPNDVLIDARKVSGILVELATQNDRIQWAIIGVGVNLSQHQFQLERLHLQPTSLALEGIEVPPALQLYQSVTREIEDLYSQVEKGGEKDLEEEFRQALSPPPQDGRRP